MHLGSLLCGPSWNSERYLLAPVPIHLVILTPSLALLRCLHAHPFRRFMPLFHSPVSPCFWEFEREMLFMGSCVWTLDPQLATLIGMVMRPLGREMKPCWWLIASPTYAPLCASSMRRKIWSASFLLLLQPFLLQLPCVPSGTKINLFFPKSCSFSNVNRKVTKKSNNSVKCVT